jgi:hypothetical protein
MEYSILFSWLLRGSPKLYDCRCISFLKVGVQYALGKLAALEATIMK